MPCRRWVTPSADRLRIFGGARGAADSGGGVTLFIRKGDTTLWQMTIANGNTTGVAFDVVTTVNTDTVIDFVINRGADGSNAADSTVFDPTILYAGQ